MSWPYCRPALGRFVQSRSMMVDDAMPRRLFEEDDDFQFSAITNRKRGSIEPSSAASAPGEKTKKKKVRLMKAC